MQSREHEHRTDELTFEQITRRLGLKESDYVACKELKEWVRRHKNDKYVPENLLEAWGFKVDQEK